MSTTIVTRVLNNNALFGNLLRPVGSTMRRAVATRFFSSAEASVPMKVPSFEELSPSEKIEMSQDLDGVYILPHFRTVKRLNSTEDEVVDWRLPHPVWNKNEVEAQEFVHMKPEGFVDRAALFTVMSLRRCFDLFTGYSLGFQNEQCMLRRVIFLETVAGVPGMVGAMNRHLGSLRRMGRDCGWIHTLLEEAENERMHLMIALCLRKPSLPIRMGVLVAQGVFFTWYTIMYAISPRFCHRFVGYLEEQAVHTYTNIIHKIDMGELPGFKTAAPIAVRKYYRLEEGSSLRDVFLAIRADENHHREVNHTFAEMDSQSTNPFPPGF